MFRNIPEQGHYEYLAFCNFYSKEIQVLAFDEYIEIKLAYLKALFHLEKAQLFHKISNQAIFEILNQEEFTEHYKIIYHQILVIKAEQLIEENKILAAQEVYINLRLLAPEDDHIKRRLFNLIYKQEQYEARVYLGISVLFLIITLFLGISNHFFIQPLLPKMKETFDKVLPFFFAIPILIILFSYSYAFIRSKKKLISISQR
ncbi:MAG: hypothetical protein ABIO44_04285 [Saprospiraceae bacterium]